MSPKTEWLKSKEVNEVYLFANSNFNSSNMASYSGLESIWNNFPYMAFSFLDFLKVFTNMCEIVRLW